MLFQRGMQSGSVQQVRQRLSICKPAVLTNTWKASSGGFAVLKKSVPGVRLVRKLKTFELRHSSLIRHWSFVIPIFYLAGRAKVG